MCNGDADGLCALTQLRLADRAAAPPVGRAGIELLTGLKRDIRLLRRLPTLPPLAAGDRLTVLDLAVEANLAELRHVLQAGVQVRWFDHHDSAELPAHPGFEPHLDTGPQWCTSLLVDAWLGGAQRVWALVGAFGDNLVSVARACAAEPGSPPLAADDLEALQRLGEALNYNAYGDSESDLLIPPSRLAERLVGHADPRDFLRADPLATELLARHQADLLLAEACVPQVACPRGALYLLPDAAWSRRVSGSFAHLLARREPQRAHAVLRPRSVPAGEPGADTCTGCWVVHVRAPLAQPGGAAELCRRFGGNGRALAGGIDDLPDDRVGAFVEAFAQAHWGGSDSTPGLPACATSSQPRPP